MSATGRPERECGSAQREGTPMGSAGKIKGADPAPAQHGVPASSVVQIIILSLVWGCNWPVLKLGVG